MKRLILFLCLWPVFAQAQPYPIIPGYPEMQWGMTQDAIGTSLDANATLRGNMASYQMPFAEFPIESHPIEGRFFFTPQDGLRYVQFSPLYDYRETTDWQGDYKHIQSHINGVYGEPYQEQDAMTIWVTETTIGRFVRYDGAGWNVRFDARRK